MGRMRTFDLLPLLGGAMMGIAVVLLYVILNGPDRMPDAAGKSGGGRWKAVAAFGFGTATGAYLVSGFIGSSSAGPTLYVFLGVLAGALVTFLIARKRIR